MFNPKNIETMKKIFTMMLLALVYGMALQAQEADYQPLVREGVVWHYSRVYGDMPLEEHCTMFFEGDSTVNDVTYKKCVEISSSGNRRVAALMREKDKVVYSIGGRGVLGAHEGEYEGEIVLYDFHNPLDMYPSEYVEEGMELIPSTVMVDGIPHNCYTSSFDYFNIFVEGIGLDGSGTLSDLELEVLTSTHYQYTGLSYVEENGDIIYKGRAHDQFTYQPLVREGVRWHTAYIENPGGMESNYHYVDNKIEFRGDTILSGVTYKKCYMYETTSWTSNAKLIGYAREASGKVMIAYENEDWFVPYETYTIPGEYCYLTGERVFYDFSDMQGFVEGWDTYDKIVSVDMIPLGTNEVTRYVMADGYNHVYYIVEGVGCDKPDHSVCPIMPFADPPTGNVSRWGGLIMLTNLDDEPLYKGSLYEKYRMQEYTDVTGDGKVDVSDVNEVINVVLGKSPASADVTGDGKVDISDVNAVINVMLGK
jgi:hypothetical protein